MADVKVKFYTSTINGFTLVDGEMKPVAHLAIGKMTEKKAAKEFQKVYGEKSVVVDVVQTEEERYMTRDAFYEASHLKTIEGE